MCFHKELNQNGLYDRRVCDLLVALFIRNYATLLSYFDSVIIDFFKEKSLFITYFHTGSPFALRVSPAGYVKVHGAGLEDSLISGASGTFVVNTQDAGTGEIKVRVGGPKGKKKGMVREGKRS